MDEIHNPYVPGAGIQPPELTGRDGFLRQAHVTIARAAAGRYGKSFIAVGLRGVGKTVLLNRVKGIAEDNGCKVALIESHEEKNLASLIIPILRRILLDLDTMGALSRHVKSALRTLKSFIGSVKISYEGFDLGLDIDKENGVADSGDLEIDIPDLFVSVGEASKSRNTVIVIIIDEMQYLSEKELSALIMAMHKISQGQLPIVLMGAGLPVLVGKMGASKSYAERLFEFPEIGALSYDDADLALAEPARKQGVRYSRHALRDIFALTQGYPYFLQVWAYVCWNTSQGPEITEQDVHAATPHVVTRLDGSFFRVRFDRLTPREKQYLRAMAEIGPGPHRSGDIADKLGIPGNKLGPCRSSLISKGMIYSPAYGDTAFTVPLFDQYMKRAMAFSPWNEKG